MCLAEFREEDSMASLVSEDATAPAFDPEDAEEMVLCARYGEMEEMVALLDAGIPVDYKNRISIRFITGVEKEGRLSNDNSTS